MSGGLPKGWVLSSLDELVGKIGLLVDGDWIESKDQDPNGEIRLFQLADVGDACFLDKSNRFINEEAFARLHCTRVLPGDILLARMPHPLGRACILPKFSYKAITAVDVCIIRPNNKFTDVAWLMYFINSYDFRNKISALSSGTTRKRISRSNLSKIPLPLPPLNEQKRIVAKLDAIMPRIDAVKERLEKIPSILKRFRQSVLTAAVTGKLTEKWREEHPEVAEWEEAKLKNICNSISDGDHQAPPKGVEGIPFLVISNITDNKINFESVTRFVSKAYFDKLKPIRIPKINDILYTVTGSIGNSVIVRDNIDFCFQRHISIIKPNIKLIDVEYLNYYLSTDFAMEQGRACATGTAQLTIPLSGLREYEIPLPPLDEQKEIVRQVDKLFTLADKVEEHYQKARARVDALAQSVLAKAFRGELVPQNPDDEPAEKLLQRIQEEKTKMEAELKTASRSARETRKNGAKSQRARSEEKQASEP